MKSPITGKEMSLHKERRTIIFRKEDFEIIFHAHQCSESGELFTSTDLDELNLNQLYNQYRDKYNIPFRDEIISIREKYNLSASKMSELLGFGTNTYRSYEAGEMPNISNAKLIQLIKDPYKFIEMVNLCPTLDDKQKQKYINKGRLLVAEEKNTSAQSPYLSYLSVNVLADIFSGYKNTNLEKFAMMVIYFAERLKPFKTKLNKLLFYADFLMFRKSCFSISGMRYIAINKGPVPDKFSVIYEYFSDIGIIETKTIEFQDYIGEQFLAAVKFKPELFSVEELAILDKVQLFFKDMSATEISEFSHFEDAWKENVSGKKAIRYDFAFSMDRPQF
jgi:DNA-binding transcriptional regulator YiaG